MGERQPILSVTIDDCEVQTFRAGGKGGQNQNKRDTGVRVIHHPSGARGESREERSQLANKRRAFGRMARSQEFVAWRTRIVSGMRPIPAKDLKVEGRVDGQWVPIDV